MAGNETYVIVGAGPAGGWAAGTLRNEGFAGRAILVGDEQWRPYERPPVSKNWLTDEQKPLPMELPFSMGEWHRRFERTDDGWRIAR